MSKSARIEGPITNEYGTFYPGDEVIAITVSTKRVKVQRAKYIGYIERQVYNRRTQSHDVYRRIQVERPAKIWSVFWKGTDEKATGPRGDREVDYRWLDGTKICTLVYNRILPVL